MSNYVKTTDFASKDALASGNPAKVIKGTEHDTEYNAIAVAVATKADLNSPVLVTPNLGTPSAGVLTNCTGVASGLTSGTVTIADAGGDTITWPLLATSQTGNLSPATDAGLTYNATTNALTTTTFIGALTGTATDTATKTGTGSTYVTDTSPTITSATLVTPALGTPASGALDNCTSNTEAVGTNNTQLATTAFCEAGFVNNDVGAGTIGSIVHASKTTNGTVASGATIAGSDLDSIVCDAWTSTIIINTVALSGTWRNISHYTATTTAASIIMSALFQRIS